MSRVSVRGDAEERLKIDEGRRPHLHAERLRRSVADDVEAEFSFRALDGRIDLAFRYVEAIGGEIEMLDQGLHRAMHALFVDGKAIVGIST